MKDFVMMICAVAVLCTIAHMPIPDEKYEKVMKLLLSAILLIVIISPLTSLSSCSIDIKKNHQTDNKYARNLEDKILSQSNSLLSKTVKDNISAILNANEISYQKISVNMDTSADGRISIGQVIVITAYPEDFAAAQALIKEHLGIEISES